jgi:hypothetical protein
MTSFCPNYLLKIISSNIITLRVKASTHGLWGGEDTVQSTEVLNNNPHLPSPIPW